MSDPRLAHLRESRKGAPGASEIAVAAPEAFAPYVPTPEDVERLKADFRVFYSVIIRHLLGRNPTALALSICYWLQHSPQRSGIKAFRGASKSWITGAYCLWLLYCDPQKKVLIVSGSSKRAIASTNWCLMLILQVPMLEHLRPTPAQRSSGQSFDVGPSLPDQSPSFNASGITGQIVGFRGDEIVGDDVETQTNSLTALMREKTMDAVKEFDSILKPGGKIKFLGTPHDADSLYNHLPEFEFMVWPARFPDAAQAKVYITHYDGRPPKDELAPYIKQCIRKDVSCIGHSTEPGRFSDEDLAAREASMGRSEFTLQFMLDTTLSDRDKYPLKMRDLIVTDLDARKGPEEITWGATNAHTDLETMGFVGDRYYKPFSTGQGYTLPWQAVTGYVDPSGRGGDETTLTIVAYLNGYIFLLWQGAWGEGSEPSTLTEIAEALVRWRVGSLEIEDNFGDGMFSQLLRPYIVAAWDRSVTIAKKSGEYDKSISWGTSVTDVKSTNQMRKEQRILSILEPVTQQHRLVVSAEVIRADLASIRRKEGEEGRRQYALFYQYTHLTAVQDSLKRDDRIEGLSGACRVHAAKLGVDPKVLIARAKDDRLDKDIAAMLMGEFLIGTGEEVRKNRSGERVNAMSAQRR